MTISVISPFLFFSNPELEIPVAIIYLFSMSLQLLFWPVLRHTTQKLIGLRKVVIHAYRQRGLGCNAVQIHNLGWFHCMKFTNQFVFWGSSLIWFNDSDILQYVVCCRILSGKNLTGTIPLELTKLPGLVEL